MSIDIGEILPTLKDGTTTIDSSHIVNPTISAQITDALAAPIVSPFVVMDDAKFILKGQQFKFAGFNYYPLTLPGTTTAAAGSIFDSARRQGVTVIRCWCFDSPDNFRSLVYPVGTPNLITNSSFETDTSDWTLNASISFANAFSRSNDTAYDGSWAIKQNSDYNTYQYFYYTATVSANTHYTWTIWYKLTTTAGSSSQLPPVQWVGTTAGDRDLVDGGVFQQASDWTQRQVSFNSGSNTTVYLTILNYGGKSVAYYDYTNLSVTQTPVIAYNEASFVRVDNVLNEARKRGIKLILSLADGNENGYNTKATYVQWANAINPGLNLTNSYPWLAFYTSSYCQQLYKDFIAKITSRVNTVNGLTYKNDPAIFAWELGNELRTNNFDPSYLVNTLLAPNLAILSNPGGWADLMSTYIKTQDPNHLVGFGDMGHTWQYADGDTVSNGTFYGVDYNIMSALPNIDYLDFHMYPDQHDGIHLQKYGQRLGYPNTVSAAGFRAQMADYVNVGHTNGKPVICTELGYVSNTTGDNTYYTLYNRAAAFGAIFTDFLDTDGADGIVLWHAVNAATSQTYDIALNAFGGEALTDNTDDTTIMELIKKYNDKFQLNILASESETDSRITLITSSITAPVISVSAAYKITPYDSTILVTGTTTVTLPDAIVGSGRIYIIKNIDASHTTTVNTTSSQTIDGLTSQTLTAQYQNIKVQSNGANWVEI